MPARTEPDTARPLEGQPAGDEPASYEAALAELERLVQRMEAGQLPLDHLLDAYRRGAELLAFCRGRLDAVQQQVEVLDGGRLEPWAPPAAP